LVIMPPPAGLLPASDTTAGALPPDRSSVHDRLFPRLRANSLVAAGAPRPSECRLGAAKIAPFQIAQA
jgi:hypothetical protein